MIQKIELINYFTSKIRNCRYLEIGSLRHETFLGVQAAIKHDVEPFPPTMIAPTFLMSSDHFFSSEKYILQGTSLIPRIYDVIFIDGLHLAEQVISDVFNASNMLVDSGYIILHDCYPQKEAHQTRTQTDNLWMGDVWKAQTWLVKQFPDRVCTIEDSDCGCGIIKGALQFEIPDSKLVLEPTWKDFEDHKKQMLNLISWDEYVKNDSDKRMPLFL